MERRPDLIVFSHLRWNFVWQRPQHLLTRIAKQRRVFFVEEPIAADGPPRWERREGAENLIVCQPHTPIHAPGFHDDQLPVIKSLLPALLEQHRIKSHAVWFYTPMALPLLDALRPVAVAYDCMDELSAFKGAPPQLLPREAELLRLADVVFTGGPSLYRSKKDRHANVHCLASSVDLAHFGSARGNIDDHPDQAALPQPRLGFFGVIDERFDVPLIEALATAKPNWQIVLVGPVVKIDPATLPRLPNIHYLGQRTYQELPSFLKGWDVCLLPFARNESTRFISPTKTLEYMAAEKPIVSTPIVDVAEPYGDIVYLAEQPEEFIAACEQALAAPSVERAARFGKMRSVLSKTSWDETAAKIDHLLEQATELRRRGDTPPSESLEEFPVIVIGAGPTGLSAAYHLGEDALLLEQHGRVGGWCRSIEVNGFTFDFAGHIMFSNDPYVHELYQMLLGDNVHWQDREAWIYSHGVHTRYPFQGALYGLPPDVIKECIVGALEARFGALKGTAPAPSSNGNSNGNGNGNGKAHASAAGAPANRCATKSVEDCCGDGILESTARLTAVSNGNGHVNGNGHAAETPAAPPREQNFEEFIYQVWGQGIAKHFAIPYNRKLWAVPLTEMETSWLGGRVPLPDIEEMLEGALHPVGKPMGPNARFGYPLRGGFQALMDGFLPHLRAELKLHARVAAISPLERIVTLQDGARYKYEHLISTMPLPVLIQRMGERVPEAVKQAAQALRYVSVRCVHLGVGRENLTEKHWIYYPEDTVFHRIFVQGNASPHCNPAGGFGLTCEITYHDEYKPLPCDGDELIQRCIDDCRRIGMFHESDPIWATAQVDLPHAYVIYDHARPKNVALIREWLAQHGILLAGRYSEWEYYNSDHAFLAGKKAADRVRELQSAPALTD